MERFFCEGKGQWQADVAEADDADEGGFVFDFFEEAVSVGGCHFQFSVVNSEPLPTRGRG
jgi:hypothetical protein